MSKHIRMDERRPERERSLKTSDFRVSRGVQNSPKNWDVIIYDNVSSQRWTKMSDVIYGHSLGSMKGR